MREPDHAHNSPDFARWRIIAAELGMPMEDIEAVARLQHRLMLWRCLRRSVRK